MRDESRPALSVAHLNGHSLEAAKRALPDNVAVKCPNCRELLVGKDWEKNLRVCQKCGHHFRLAARERVRLLLDADSFVEIGADLMPTDPLDFVARSQSYRDKLRSEQRDTGVNEGLLAGHGLIEGMPIVVAVMDFQFIGGSMGSVVGEKITQAIELATTSRTPLLIITSSGGARMYEGAISLMQMAKTSAALARLADAGVPYISLMADPTSGGVTASFAMLGDVILAEPGALICFSGPRVIEQFIHQRLPKDAATSEFVLAHGMIDGIVHRRNLRATLARLLRLYQPVL